MLAYMVVYRSRTSSTLTSADSGLQRCNPNHRSADQHRTIATATPPSRRGPRRRRSSTPGLPTRTRSHPRPASLFLRAHNAIQPLTRYAGTARWADSPQRSPRTRPTHLLELGFEVALGLALQWP